MSTPLVRAVITVRAMPARAVVITAMASVTALAFGSARAWPAWALAGATLAPWLPVFTLGTARTYRNDGYLALFYVLAVTQTAHWLEHVAQVSQLHLLDKTGPAARGIFGALDIEWVHFTWNAIVFVAALVLLQRFRQNAWLWVLAGIATWHIAEHSFMIMEYLRQGKPGHPGFLSKGGILGGGLPLVRPDLHFFYNLIETVPLVGGLFWQLRRSSLVRSRCGEGFKPGALATDGGPATGS
ncbi:MAG: hypothetical protein ACRDJM_06815 [Actinomycetota bacterium]